MTYVDGNAAAGALSIAFGADLSRAGMVCGSCGQDHPLGEAHVYRRCPGMVIRCPQCSAAEIVLVERDHRIQVTFKSLATLRLGSERQ